MRSIVLPVSVPRKPAVRRLLTVGHSYVIRSNRQLAEEIQKQSNGSWRVTVAAPAFYRGNPRYGDLRPETLVINPSETVQVVGVPMFPTGRVHVALYGNALRTLMASGFDAIHCWEEPFVLAGGQLARWTPSSATLTFFTAQNNNKWYPPPFGAIERYAIKRAAGWVAAGSVGEKALRDRPGYAQRPHRIIGLGIDSERFRPDAAARARTRAHLGWPEDEPVVFGFLGQLRAKKGVPMLLRVLDRLTIPWRALFVGSGDLEQTVAQWASRHGERARLVRSVPHTEVPAYLQVMNVLCTPSQTMPDWKEQFGRVLIEAFACGVPVVASDSGEIPFVVGDAGRIVAEKDEDAWVSALSEMGAGAELRAMMKRRGLARVQSNFTWEAIAKQYLEFFELVWERKARACEAS